MSIDNSLLNLIPILEKTVAKKTREAVNCPTVIKDKPTNHDAKVRNQRDDNTSAGEKCDENTEVQKNRSSEEEDAILDSDCSSDENVKVIELKPQELRTNDGKGDFEGKIPAAYPSFTKNAARSFPIGEDDVEADGIHKSERSREVF